MTGIRIGEAARRLGLTTRTLRYYEEMGLLPSGDRAQGKFRAYTEDDIRRLERITELKHLLGFNLHEIREILTAEDELKELRRQYDADADDLARREGILTRALELNARLRSLVDAKVSALEQMRGHLAERADAYRAAMGDLKVSQ